MTHTLFLNVGYKCNYDCVYCVIGGIQEEFGTDDFVSFEKIKEIPLEGYKYVWLTGGEPTIHPEILDIIEYFDAAGLKLYMQTNGSMIGQKSFFEKIKKYRIQYQFPLNSFDEKIHNTIMKHPKAYKLTMSGITNLTENGLSDELTVKIILTRLNFNHIEKTVRHLYANGVRKFYIAYPVLKGNYKNYLNKLVPKYSHIKKFLDVMVELEAELGIKYVLESFPYCMLRPEQYKNVWESSQLHLPFIEKLSESELTETLNIASSCFKKYGSRDEDRNCNTCKIIDLKERLNNVSFLHKGGLDKEINANCLDNLHKEKSFDCLKCSYSAICTGVAKEYVQLFGFSEFDHKNISKDLTKSDILTYMKYVREAE